MVSVSLGAALLWLSAGATTPFLASQIPSLPALPATFVMQTLVAMAIGVGTAVTVGFIARNILNTVMFLLFNSCCGSSTYNSRSYTLSPATGSSSTLKEPLSTNGASTYQEPSQIYADGLWGHQATNHNPLATGFSDKIELSSLSQLPSMANSQMGF